MNGPEEGSQMVIYFNQSLLFVLKTFYCVLNPNKTKNRTIICTKYCYMSYYYYLNAF